MNKKSQAIFGCFGAIFVIVLEIVLTVFLSGWALSTLWGWFIVPVFNAPLLTYLQSVGLMSVISFVTRPIPGYESLDKKKEEFWERLFYGFMMIILKPVLAVLFGWIIFSLIKG